MPKRTTIILDDDLYERLVIESIRRYGTSRALSKVINELLRESLETEKELLELIYSEKVATISSEEFEEFRKELDKRFIKR